MDICQWAQHSEAERAYHDSEWGVPTFDDQLIFEFICLEGAQAGLSWRLILQKRAAYRAAFFDFDFYQLANVAEPNIAEIMANHEIVRNRLKVASVFTNAKAAVTLVEEYGSLAKALWQFTGGVPIVNHHQSDADVATATDESRAMSRFLKKRGFKFVGETICYSLMQALGMVNDHVVTCPRYQPCCELADSVKASPQK
ncbi:MULTISPECIES: DNA-3-methyladenine glycosylase I [Salinivibrio]|uniref:DNA-3-methyladenine glycosidase n=2 Tax=Salinivibrio TaxID=51366 RepID=A0ABX3K764_9GAMM|nr:MULTISPECIES: DNA-3-methyladenine glycosylase I [Salinivibrio]MPS31237.1 DNA-3-methyladenine glycosylase I [Salinivibrio sp. VYel7]MPX92637.1 DNA-3-methyladenine glycosylase I [Salinivibrio sp. VYel9]MPX96864.1 DNA-3-methyladenine glycosylase I [Salinivibrio sp. VYel6]MPX98870.1 DNA-3-methyladenine glycosylase I [Salinivibrio sp. VYel4]MPY01429.1 DNA-3-methyladenine glycosylase I [Salinivibrio sp. VYel5]